MGVSREGILEWLSSLEKTYAGNKEWLTELDSAIGDADHGINMDRGFKAVGAEIASTDSEDIGAILKSVATVLIRTVGGASGPLYGTFFLRASATCAGKTELDTGNLVAAFQAGVKGVRERGKAQAGDKTMVDTLLPAVDAMQKALEAGSELSSVLRAAVLAAEEGMKKTIPVEAKKGRASYLGPRSAGHEDPGATSAWLMLKAAADAWSRVAG